MTRKRKVKIKGGLYGIILSVILFAAYNFVPDSLLNKFSISNNTSNTAYVERVVDGDTLKIIYNGKHERLRMLGIDTPESVHPSSYKNTPEGKIASEYTKSRLEGKNVTLEFDTEMHDKYGRILAYVYLGDEMINETLLKNGYAHVLIVPPNKKYENRFKSLEYMAKIKKIGIWK